MEVVSGIGEGFSESGLSQGLWIESCGLEKGSLSQDFLEDYGLYFLDWRRVLLHLDLQKDNVDWMMCDFVDAEIDDECCGFLYHHDHKRSWMNAVESLVLSVEQYKML